MTTGSAVGENPLLIVLRRGSVQVLQFSYSHTLDSSNHIATRTLGSKTCLKPYSVLLQYYLSSG